MNNRALSWTGLTLSLLTFTACNSLPQDAAVPHDQTTIPVEAWAVNQSLDKMARLFAQAVTDTGLRQQIHDQAAARFDGDTNVLYKTLASSSAVRQKLAASYTRDLGLQAGDAGTAIDTLARSIPRFQVAVPVKFDTWNPKTYTPLVGYAPAGVEDTTLKTITAYDAAGKAYTLDAQKPPARPVIILSLNERTDDAGNVLAAYRPDAAQTTGTELSPQGRYEVRVEGLYLVKTLDPWPYSDAEVVLVAEAQNHSLSVDGSHFVGANDSGKWYNQYLRYIGTTTSNVGFFWYEDDVNISGSVGISFSYKGAGFNAGVNFNNADDKFGSMVVPNSHFSGTSNRTYSTGLIKFTLD